MTPDPVMPEECADCFCGSGRHYHEGDRRVALPDSTPTATTLREDALQEAIHLIVGERNHTYGAPTQNFTDTARTWSALLRPKLAPGKEIEPGDVAMLMIALKLARMVAQPKRDNWVDIAGYAGCGYEADVDSGRIAPKES